jgi:hypothetical protein
MLALLEDLLEGVVDLDAGAEGLVEVVEAPGLDHELLEVDGVVGVLAAVEDVEHGDGEGLGAGAAEVAVEGQARGLGGGRATAIETPRMALAPSSALLGVPSSSIISASMPSWSRASMPSMAGAMRVVDVLDGLEDALAQVQALSPSRSSTASFSPVEAPEGTAARPMAPPRGTTSTSTVGLPRESRIWRAWTISMSKYELKGGVALWTGSGHSLVRPLGRDMTRPESN